MIDEKLRQYLAEHSGGSLGDVGHRALVDKAGQRLKELGAIGVIDVFKGVIIEGDGYQGETDLVAITEEELFVIEAKLMRGDGIRAWRNTRSQINRQLKRDYDFFRQHSGVAARMIGILKYAGTSKIEHYELPRPIGHLLGGLR